MLRTVSYESGCCAYHYLPVAMALMATVGRYYKLPQQEHAEPNPCEEPEDDDVADELFSSSSSGGDD